MREGLGLGFLKDLRGGFFEGLRGYLRLWGLLGRLRAFNLRVFKFKNSKTAAQRAFEFKFHVASKAFA